MAQAVTHDQRLSYTQGIAGSNPAWPTIESETTPIYDRFRTLLSTGYCREGLIKFQISNESPFKRDSDLCYPTNAWVRMYLASR